MMAIPPIPLFLLWTPVAAWRVDLDVSDLRMQQFRTCSSHNVGLFAIQAA